MNAPTTVEPTGVSVRHDARIAALVALLAAVLTVAWFARALRTADPLDWVWCLVPAAVGLLQLLVVRDARTPLLVADELGVRVRRGHTWHGVQWPDVDRVEVRSGGRMLADGRLVIHPRDRSEDPFADPVVEEPSDDAAGVPDSPVLRALSVPLGPTTRIDYDGLTGDLVADLDALGQGRVPVLVLTRAVRPSRAESPEAPDAPEAVTDEPVHEPVDGWPDHRDESHESHAVESAHEVEETDATDETEVPDETAAAEHPARRWARGLAERARARRLPAQEQDDETDVVDEDGRVEDEPVAVPVVEHEPVAEPVAEQPSTEEPEDEQEGVAAYEPVDPSRTPRRAARAEVVRETVRRLPDPPALPAQRRPGGPVVVARIDDTDPDGLRAGAAPIALPGEVGDEAPHPVAEPVIGPLVAAARQRARLSIDTLSERTRIRPHVLECIEVDDFAACGGDFYARGHLRTLARVFGLDPAELVGLYDQHYATAEIEARQVFEAELATGIGGGVRTATSGPRWSLLAASVLALVGIWGVARAFNDTPQELVSPAPDVVDVAGLASGEEPDAAPRSTLAALTLRAEGASPQVVVRDRDGKILLASRLADGAQQQVIGLAPFDVTSSNGEAVSVTYLGKGRGTVGDSEKPDNRQVG